MSKQIPLMFKPKIAIGTVVSERKSNVTRALPTPSGIQAWIYVGMFVKQLKRIPGNSSWKTASKIYLVCDTIIFDLMFNFIILKYVNNISNK